MYLSKSLVAGIAAGCLVVAGSAFAQTVATVNGKAIPQAKLEFILKARNQGDTPEIRSALKDNLITREIVSQEAIKKGFDKDPDLATQMDMAKQEFVMQAYLKDYQKANPITDEMMKKEYDRIKAAQADVKEYRARHILVEKEQEAKDIIAQLKKGGKFEKLADKSKDTGSKTKGGDLGWSPPQNFVKPFADALTKLKKGQLTDAPVQTQFGWHVIRLDDERPIQFPPFEEVKAQIQQSMLQQQQQQLVTDLRSKAKIE